MTDLTLDFKGIKAAETKETARDQIRQSMSNLIIKKPNSEPEVSAVD